MSWNKSCLCILIKVKVSYSDLRNGFFILHEAYLDQVIAQCSLILSCLSLFYGTKIICVTCHIPISENGEIFNVTVIPLLGVTNIMW